MFKSSASASLLFSLSLLSTVQAQDVSPALLRAPHAVQNFYRAFLTGDGKLLDSALSVDWQDLPLNPGQLPGLAGMKPVVAGFHKTMPNLQITTDAVIIAGNYVTVRSTLKGTPAGPFLGFAPNGKSIEFRTTDIHRLVNGKIVQTWHLEDLFGAAAQLGAK